MPKEPIGSLRQPFEYSFLQISHVHCAHTQSLLEDCASRVREPGLCPVELGAVVKIMQQRQSEPAAARSRKLL